MACESSKGCFSDYIVGAPDAVKINVLLAPLSSYTWALQDGFGNEYLQDFTTDENGAGLLDLGQLPAGFANAGQASLLIPVRTSGAICTAVPLPLVQHFDCIELNFRAGNPDKDWVGCPVGLAPDLPDLGPVQNFAGTVDNGRSNLSWDALPDAAEYIIRQGGQTIYQGPDLTFIAQGLTNGQPYTFSNTPVAPGFAPGPAVSIEITPLALNVVVRVLYRDTNTLPSEAEILAGNAVPIASGADFAVQFTNPATQLKYLWVFEPQSQPVKTVVNYGVADEPIGSQGVFGVGGTVTTFRGYVSNYKTAIPDSPATFKK